MMTPAATAESPAPPQILRFQRSLQDSQWWPHDRLIDFQFRTLSPLVAHAHRTVPIYRHRLETAGVDPSRPLEASGWARLPPLTRADIRRFGVELRSTHVPAAHGRVLTTKTSGSTGTPVTVQGTVFDALLGKAMLLRHCLWHPHDFTVKHASIRRVSGHRAFDYPHGRQLPRWSDTATFPFATGPAAILSIRASIAQQAEWLVRQDPDYLMTYPSNLKFLAAHCREQGIRLPHLEHATTTGEALAPEVREECRRAWNVPVIDLYSAQEVGIIALQCPAHEHYHVAAETMLVEVLDEEGRACGPGKTGRVVVTPLYNYAMPLLRYAIGDYAKVGAPCPCGRGLPVLEKILGRERNALLVTRDGERYWPSFGTRRLTELGPIVQHQFVQTTLDHIEVRLVTARPLTGKEEQSLRAHMLAMLPQPFELSFSYMPDLARNATGKFETFICEVSA